MSITLIVILLIVFIVLWLLIVHTFDITLIKGVIKAIMGNVDLNKEELKDAVKRFLENRSLNRAHKLYFWAVTTIAGGNTILSFARGILKVKQGENTYQLDLLYDNGIPVWVVLIIILLITICQCIFLYTSAKRYKADIISSAAAIINDEFSFVPNQDWFRLKTEKAISDLGRSIDLSINFTYEYFDDALASTCRDNRITKVFADYIKELYIGFSREREALVNSIGEEQVQKIEVIITEIRTLLTKTAYDGDEPKKVVEDIEEIENLLLGCIRDQKLSYSDYKFTKLHASLGKVRERTDNPWIRSMSSPVFIVNGQGGCGKTHLLAKLSSARIERNLPTIFFLGKLITDTENPLSQILTILDINCKKETFLKALDAYGQKNGRVLMVIDGINEGKGLSIWKSHLLSFINEFKPYTHISLILSVRTNSDHNGFSKFITQQQFPSYRHRGFEQNTTGAVEYMFRSFNVPLPSWPLFQREFTNPLLLTLFCRTHSGEKTPPKFEGKLEIIRNYIKHFNERLAESFSYSSQSPVLQLALKALGREMVNENNRGLLKREKVIVLFGNVVGMPQRKDAYLDAIVDEGVLNENEDSEGISYSFGYDTIGAYLKGEVLAEKVPFEQLTNQSESVLEALTDLIPQYRGKEFFELPRPAANIDFYDDYLVDLFLKGLPTRTNLTSGGVRILGEIFEAKDYNTIINVIVNNPFRTDFPLSVNTLDDLLTPMEMVKRDEVWTQAISTPYELSGSLLNLAQWGWSASPDMLQSIDKESLKNVVHLLAWSLSTTYIELRDKSSRALINILKNEKDLIIDFIKCFGLVNDPYITERVFAVSFGCCTGNASKEYVTAVTQLVYDIVFKEGNPPEHILIRDYAKCIVEYSVTLGCGINYQPELVRPPYANVKKGVYVPTDEILKYELKYDQVEDKQLLTAQNNIMHSMRTEYSSRGMYGDFGRYVFQSALDNWSDDIEQISYFGIKMIFEEFGYDAKVFKGFDGRHSSWERYGNKIERIGKKYQWIALYRIAAILDDNHYGEEFDRSWNVPTIYHLRRFDPTIMMNPDIRDYTTSLPAYRVPEYDMSFGTENEWMMAWKKMPPISHYLEYKNKPDNWICLHAYYTVSSISNDDTAYPIERELWSFIQAFLVDKEHRKEMCELIDKEGLSGRNSTENHETEYSYYREYYWSESYKTQIEAHGYTECEYNAGRRDTLYKVQPSYLLYDISEYADASINSSREMILPSPYLFNGLNLRFSVTDGVWLAEDGSVACYDSYWVHGGHAGLFFRKDLLLRYLHENAKCIVWPVLMERMYKPGGRTYWPRIQVGGYVWMGEDGVLHHKFRSYEPTELQKKWKKIQSKYHKLLRRGRKKLVEKGLIKISLHEQLDMLSEMGDYEDDND